MNALAEDQLMRLRGLLAGTGIPFGMRAPRRPGCRRCARRPAAASAAIARRNAKGSRMQAALTWLRLGGEPVGGVRRFANAEHDRRRCAASRSALWQWPSVSCPPATPKSPNEASGSPIPTYRIPQRHPVRGRRPRSCRSCGMRTGLADSERSPVGTRPAGHPMRQGSPTPWFRGYRHERSGHEGMGCRGVGRLRVGAAALQ